MTESRPSEHGTRNTVLDRIDLTDVVAIAKRAGDAIMEIYARDFAVNYKKDESPLTEADLISHKIISEGLRSIGARSTEHGTLPILSEEGRLIPYEERKHWEYYWCIDPLDGTKEFIKKNGEFTVNIALIHKDTPVLGVVYAPALGELYFAKKGEGAFKTVLRTPGSEFRKEDFESAVLLPLSEKRNEDHGIRNTWKRLKIVASKSHLNDETKKFIEGLVQKSEHGAQSTELVSKGSSLKLCMVAEGSADIYPRLAPTMEWDTAAADAIVRESGKMTYRFSSANSDTPLVYNKKELLNPWFVVR